MIEQAKLPMTEIARHILQLLKQFLNLFGIEWPVDIYYANKYV